MGQDVIDEPVLVAAHSKKIVGFLDYLRNGLVVRTFAVYEFAFRIKALTAKTVRALIFAEVDIARVIDIL